MAAGTVLQQRTIFRDGSLILNEPLDYKCLALTGSFETGSYIPECFAGLGGDFEDRGMSMGVLHWNFGDDTLQPLLLDMMQEHAGLMKEIFREDYKTLAGVLDSGRAALMAFARSIQDPQVHLIHHPWRKMLKTLGYSYEFQQVQRKHAAGFYASAMDMCGRFGLWSERAVALMFDIKVQNSGISEALGGSILAAFKKLPSELSDVGNEVLRMRIIADCCAGASAPRKVGDVRARKLCCANGEGIVHGIRFDLLQQFGIGLGKVLEG